MILSTAPCPCSGALRQAFNAALRSLVDRGVRNQLLLKYNLPLSFAVELQGARSAWPVLKELGERDLLREVLEARVLRVATVVKSFSQPTSAAAFNTSFLREIVDEIDLHYSGVDGLGEISGRNPPRVQPIQIDYVIKASTAVALQALDAGQAHMTDINMVLSHHPSNGITMSSRYSRSDQVMTQSTSVIVKSDTNIASLPALREAIFLSLDQQGRTLVVDNVWNQQSLAHVLPPYTIYELLSDGVPRSHLLDVLFDEEAVAVTAQLPLHWSQGLRHFSIGATYASGALFLMDRHGNKCVGRGQSSAESATTSSTNAKAGEDPALSSLRREFTKKSISLNSIPKYYHGDPAWHQWQANEFSRHNDNEDSYPATPGPWSTEPSTPVGETELFDSLRVDTGEPLASGRRYLRTRALHDSYNAALVQLLRNSVLDRLVEELQEINVVPFFDCGGTVPGSLARSFPPPARIPPDDALRDILRTGVVLVGMPMGSVDTASSPEVLYAQRAVLEVVAAIGAEYRVPLQTRFIRFPTAKHVLRALHKGLIHLADARILFEYVSPQTHLGFRVRPTCALGASRLWMMARNVNGMTSLEELHRALEKSSDAAERRVAVVEQQLLNTVASVLPSGVVVEVMTAEEASEALIFRQVVAVFGMATQQRRQLRELLNTERKHTGKNDGYHGAALADGMEEHPPPQTPRSEEPFSHTSAQPQFSDASTGSVDSFAKSSIDVRRREDPTLDSPNADVDDLFHELAKAEGLDLRANEISQQALSPWIEVDTGVTAVMHSFLALSLRPQRTSV